MTLTRTLNRLGGVKGKRTPAQVAADAKRTGRPPLPAKERRNYVANVRITEAERREFERQARVHGLTLSEVLMLPWRKEGRRP